MTNRTFRYIVLSHKESRKGQHLHKLGATVVRGGTVLAKAANTMKTHAEVRAIGRAGDCRGATVYVVRRNWRLSKPCPKCWEALKEAGVVEVVYLDNEGQAIFEEVL